MFDWSDGGAPSFFRGGLAGLDGRWDMSSLAVHSKQAKQAQHANCLCPPSFACLAPWIGLFFLSFIHSVSLSLSLSLSLSRKRIGGDTYSTEQDTKEIHETKKEEHSANQPSIPRGALTFFFHCLLPSLPSVLPNTHSKRGASSSSLFSPLSVCSHHLILFHSVLSLIEFNLIAAFFLTSLSNLIHPHSSLLPELFIALPFSSSSLPSLLFSSLTTFHHSISPFFLSVAITRPVNSIRFF